MKNQFADLSEIWVHSQNMRLLLAVVDHFLSDSVSQKLQLTRVLIKPAEN